MTTVEEIIKYSKPHPNGIEGARQIILYNDKVRMSIVGGSKGLYGDFSEDFEIAFLDQETNEFVTKFYSPNNDDDVIGYVSGLEVLDLINNVFAKGFQVK